MCLCYFNRNQKRKESCLKSRMVCGHEQTDFSPTDWLMKAVCLQSKTAFMDSYILTDSTLLIMKRCLSLIMILKTPSGENKLRLLLIFK